MMSMTRIGTGCALLGAFLTAALDAQSMESELPRLDGALAQGEEATVDQTDAPPAEEFAVDRGRYDTSDLFSTGIIKEDLYVGGRGLITTQGMSGMFLNPTSGTLPQGALTVQWCTLLQDSVLAADGSDIPTNAWGNGVMVAYGITDWLEAGAFILNVVLDDSPFKGFSDTETLTVYGPFARVRLLKDEADSWIPEVSVGGIYLDGDSTSDLFARAELFAAASKYFEIDEEGLVKGARVHGGVRVIWKPERIDPASDANGVVPYIGAELGLPYNLWGVAEVALQDDIQGPRTPYAMGVQWRPNEVVGISVAGVQPGDAGRISLYIGVGLNFQF